MPLSTHLRTHTHTHTHTHLTAGEEEEEEPPDNVRLWEDGWKERYYLNKFGVPSDDDEFVGKLVSVRGEKECMCER